MQNELFLTTEWWIIFSWIMLRTFTDILTHFWLRHSGLHFLDHFINGVESNFILFYLVLIRVLQRCFYCYLSFKMLSSIVVKYLIPILAYIFWTKFLKQRRFFSKFAFQSLFLSFAQLKFSSQSIVLNFFVFFNSFLTSSSYALICFLKAAISSFFRS
jgi:hypothetical protein